MPEQKLKVQENEAVQKLVTGSLALSYAERDEITYETLSLAGFLDMLYLITEGGLWSDCSDDVKLTILEARDKASALAKRFEALRPGKEK